ncbi:MAG: sensor histidine kinase [Gemmatirosa sp.]
MPTRRSRGALAGAPDARALIALLLLTLLLSGLLAFEAEQEVGAHRVASARVLREHLAATGRDALDATAAALRESLVSSLGPAVDARAATPYDVLPSPTALAARVGTRLGCAVPGPVWMRLDLRDGSLATAGHTLPPAVERWAADAARAIARGGAAATDGGYAIVAGQGAMAGRVLALGVKRAPFDAPLAVYGLVTCDDVFGAALLGAARRTGAGGDALSLALADSLLAIEVHDASGVLLGRAPARGGVATPGAQVVAERKVAGLTLRAIEGPGAAHRVLVPARRRTRVLVVGALAAITGALGLLALRQLRREQELVRLRADFTSSVSHELRTPLAQILLFGETLALGRVHDEAQRRAAADTIVREARRLMHMVENVLHAARAERRANPVHVQAVALAPLVHEIAQGFAPLAEASGMRVEVDVPAALGARADAGALRQIVLNLLDNALRYGARAQTIRVAARAEAGATVRLWVDDAGPGIAPRDRQRVWLPFVRLTRDRQAGDRTGSGLGLAVVADLVRALDGEAWITDAPGGGTRVCVRLPEASMPRVPERAVDAPAAAEAVA